MHRRTPRLLVLGLVLGLAGAAHAQYRKLSGPPEFAESINGIPTLKPGQTTTVNDGEGGVTTTLSARTSNSAEFVSTQPRYGTHRMRYAWDSPPDIMKPGEVPSVGVRWEFVAKWNRFAPQMMTLTHLDWSEDWYTRPAYGQPVAERNSTIRVTTRDNDLTFYTQVTCGGGTVRVEWKYKHVGGTTPAGPATGPAPRGPPAPGTPTGPVAPGPRTPPPPAPGTPGTPVRPPAPGTPTGPR